ncbi:16S rRNA (uracil(1498)-N(3))-methyltransferase [Membranicola marinus]|uniref:Ribosomal RNA small subunit methyltransferase E n=1 Tax=Membranihabitans marinus TaxID=1227546 RepID=A0A953L5H1_9BACT|nr:RsmE family RNA methyltransferase [Membranihabitans marinus]MBY5956577.1 16S rRNA (uracil(1498)-N(3))-methyltransferase [Membranihabitans marinus]
MALFLIDHQKDNRIFFSTEVSHHMVRSLRKKPGDSIHASDGKGLIFTAIIESATNQNVEAVILDEEFIQKNWEVHVACSLIKKESRFEVFLEKATEIGVHRITPLQCERTVKPKLRVDRARKIIQSAVQQSFNPHVPILDSPMEFSTYIGQSGYKAHERYIATAVEREETRTLEQQYSGKNPVHILIGPEGDFTPEESEIALKAGWNPVSLGMNRLRTETAAIAAVQIIKSCYQIKTQATQ